MKTLFLLTLAVAACASLLLAATLVTTETIPPVGTTITAPPRKKMKAFGSEREMERYFRQVVEKDRHTRLRYKANADSSATGLYTMAAGPDPASD